MKERKKVNTFVTKGCFSYKDVRLKIEGFPSNSAKKTTIDLEVIQPLNHTIYFHHIKN